MVSRKQEGGRIMAYLRWSYSNWYAYWDCAGYVQVWYVNGGSGRYDFNSDIDKFIKREFKDVPDDDKKELKEALIEANKDYNENKEEE